MRVVLLASSSAISLLVNSTLCRSVATRAIIVSVLPKPIGSAIIPPRNGGGSLDWWELDIKLMKLASVRVYRRTM